MSEEPLSESLQNPNTAQEFIQRGWSLHIRDRFQESEADFRQALEMDPDSVEAIYGIGMSLRVQGKEEEANKHFARVLEILGHNKIDLEPSRANMFRHLAKTQIKISKIPGNQEAEA